MPTPRLRALVRVGPEAAVLAYEHHDGTTLASRNPGCSDEELGQIWDAVGRLHARKVTHRALTADRILLTGDGQAVLLDPGDGDVAASDLQIRLDVAQLLAELALYVGPDRAASLALEQGSANELVTVVPLLQPVVLARSTRKALRSHRAVLPDPAQPAPRGGARRRGRAGAAGAHPVAHPADHGRRRRRGLPAGRRAGPG